MKNDFFDQPFLSFLHPALWQKKKWNDFVEIFPYPFSSFIQEIPDGSGNFQNLLK